jgi:hypothetical protein
MLALMVSRRDLSRGLKDGGQQASAGLARARFRLVLVGAQVVGCCALLVVAGSMGRGLQRLLVVDPGFTFDRVALLDPSLARHGISGDAARAYWSQVVQKIASHPDVVQTSLAFPAPLGGAVNTSRYGADSGALSITVMRVEPAFFPLLEIPLLAGRNFEPGDDSSLVIISRRLGDDDVRNARCAWKGLSSNQADAHHRWDCGRRDGCGVVRVKRGGRVHASEHLTI